MELLKEITTFAKMTSDMTQIVLNIENQSIATSLKKVLATMDGVSIAATRKLSSYEKSKLEAKNGVINTYASVDEMFSKLGL